MTLFRKLVGLFILLALIASPYAMATDVSYTDNHSEYRDVVSSNAAVTVFTEEQNENTIDLGLEGATSNIAFRDNMEAVSSTDIVIIDESWTNNNDVSSEIEYLIMQGNPVIMYTSTPDILIDFCTENRISHSFPATAQAFCLKIAKDGTICCYSVDGMGESEQALTYAYNWAVEKIEADSTADDNIRAASDPYWGSAVQSNVDVGCGNFGEFYIRTLYYPLIETDSAYNYVCSHFSLESSPYTSRATCDMVVYSDVDSASSLQDLVDYDPTSTVGVSTVNVNLGVSFIQNGVSVSATKSWSYTLENINLHDNSIPANELMDLWHDVDETTTSGHEDYTVQPGNIVRISETGSGDYVYQDEYRVTFANCNTFLWSHWHSAFTEYTRIVYSTVYC